MTTVLLHGLGQGPESWDGTAKKLNGEVLRPDLFAPVRGGTVTWKGIYRAFAGYCAELDRPLRLCGLSLGGVLALQYALEHPERVGALETEMVQEFFYAISYAAAMNLHIKELHGENTHHVIEAMFKAFARALDMATGKDERIQGLLSTKGAL